MNSLELANELLSLPSGATIVSFWSLTEAPQYKKGNPFFPIKKLSRVNGLVQFNYENNVNAALKKVGEKANFEAGESWHVPVMNNGKFTALAKHKDTGELYLRFRPLHSLVASRYFSKKKELQKQEIQQYLKPHSISLKQVAAGLQEDETVAFRCYKLSNILEITHRLLPEGLNKDSVIQLADTLPLTSKGFSLWE